MKLCDEIQLELRRFLSSGNDILIPNFFVRTFECDLFRLTKANHFYEYEIKISRSDYFNDFKKTFGSSHKHTKIKSGERCNRFYFVVPKDLISIDEVPDYAGLMYFSKKWPRIEVVKKAKLIHSNTNLINIRSVADTLSFREQQWRRKFREEQEKNPDILYYQKEIKRLEKELESNQKEAMKMRFQINSMEREKRKATI